jgi:hypothetical protein
MEALFNKAKTTLGIEIKDNRHIGMGFHVVNENTEYCLLSYRSDFGFYINCGGRWFTERSDMDAFVKKFNALAELTTELNSMLKIETNKK